MIIVSCELFLSTNVAYTSHVLGLLGYWLVEMSIGVETDIMESYSFVELMLLFCH